MTAPLHDIPPLNSPYWPRLTFRIRGFKRGNLVDFTTYCRRHGIPKWLATQLVCFLEDRRWVTCEKGVYAITSAFAPLDPDLDPLQEEEESGPELPRFIPAEDSEEERGYSFVGH